jgi:hypothetical protein
LYWRFATRPTQPRHCPDDQEPADVGLTSLRHPAKPFFPTRRELSWNEAEPSGKVTTASKAGSIALSVVYHRAAVGSDKGQKLRANGVKACRLRSRRFPATGAASAAGNTRTSFDEVQSALKELDRRLGV